METLTCTVDQSVGSAPNTLRCSLPANDPSWADVFSAWGTVGATVAAVLFGLVSLCLSLHERRIRRIQEAKLAAQAVAERQAAIRSQAERVACWLEWEKAAEPTPVGLPGKLFQYHKAKWRIVVQNASDQPIWNVGISHWSLGSSEFTQIPVVAAGVIKSFEVKPKPDDEGLTIEEAVTVRFRDNAGRSWCRPAHAPGQLQLEQNDSFTHLENAEPSLLRSASRQD